MTTAEHELWIVTITYSEVQGRANLKASARAHSALLDKQEAFERRLDFGAPEVAALERQVRTALDRELGALKVLCETSPKSAETFVAWLQYLRPYLSDGIEGIYTNGATDHFWKTLEKTARDLASRIKR